MYLLTNTIQRTSTTTTNSQMGLFLHRVISVTVSWWKGWIAASPHIISDRESLCKHSYVDFAGLMIGHGNVYTLQVKLAQHDKAVSTIFEISVQSPLVLFCMFWRAALVYIDPCVIYRFTGRMYLALYCNSISVDLFKNSLCLRTVSWFRCILRRDRINMHVCFCIQ